MRNDTCIICGQKFEPREGKLYCSENCKQKAYNDRKKESNPEEETDLKCQSMEVKKNILYTFYLEEFELVKKRAKEKEIRDPFNFLDFDQYCYFRRLINTQGKVNIDFIVNAISKYSSVPLDYHHGDVIRDEFEKFQRTIHSGQIEIIEKIPEHLNDNISVQSQEKVTENP
jgi:hypothetical protein